MTLNVKLWVAVPREFVAFNVTRVTPAAVGEPVTAPVVELSERPEGKVPVTLKVGAGYPVAVTVKVLDTPTS